MLIIQPNEQVNQIGQIFQQKNLFPNSTRL